MRNEKRGDCCLGQAKRDFCSIIAAVRERGRNRGRREAGYRHNIKRTPQPRAALPAFNVEERDDLLRNATDSRKLRERAEERRAGQE